MSYNRDTEWMNAAITTIKGIAAKRALSLAKLNIFTIRDILLNIPIRYEDRTKVKKICETLDGEECSIEAAVIAEPAHSRPRKGLSLWRLAVSDGSGVMNLVWFNQDYAVKEIHTGDRFLFFGTIKRMANRIEMTSPVFEKVKEGEQDFAVLMPVYGLTDGISQNQMRAHVKEAIKKIPAGMKDFLPVNIRNQYEVLEWKVAIRLIHFPSLHSEETNDRVIINDIDNHNKRTIENQPDYDVVNNFEHIIQSARKRLAFDELLQLHIGLQVQRGDNLKKPASPIRIDSLVDVRQTLTFQLTSAQSRVLEEILRDMNKTIAMNRLLQGDVGSGKTIVALLAAVSTIRDGFQVAFMVPTEILAEQHMESAKKLLDSFGIRVSLLKGSMRKKLRDEVLCLLAQGGPDLVIGTHALLTEDVKFAKLGLVITDEQHRFGVRQRAVLAGKGDAPHLLVMTATPIPRTLSLMLYGDLDISILDGLPPGRKAIRTYVVQMDMRKRIEAFIRKTAMDKQQIYVVCPLVSESEEMQAESAEEMAKQLQDHVFPDLRVGLIHGKMKNSDKDFVMKSFVERNFDILVATTVIEVGVNVPNATVMVIENAERFGLSQLHQLRGRVGRGAEQSHCILFKGGGGKNVDERLAAIAGTTDGFELAELDLKLRGPGEVFGTRQHGLPECRIANIYEDIELLKQAKEVVTMLIENHSATIHGSVDCSNDSISEFDHHMEEKTQTAYLDINDHQQLKNLYESLYTYLLHQFVKQMTPLVMN